MANQIVILDPVDRTSQTVKPITFAELGVGERTDLEEWIKDNPDILGTRLLIISSEYDRFEKSHKRLDLLALDEEGKVVIIELKRDAAGTLADLQAIRYAAFCSTLTFPQVVELRAEYARVSVEDATREIREFVDDPDFSKLDNQPRIILAAGGFDDQELTSCVLWLRSFRVDISCVELAPYRASDQKRLILVPRVIISLPEATDYVVGTEKKEAEQGKPPRGERGDYTNESLDVLDACFEVLRGVVPNAQPRYNEQFVGITLDGQPNNFVMFNPRKKLVRAKAYVADRDAWIHKLEKAGLEVLPGGGPEGSVRLRIRMSDVSAHRDLLRELFAAAYKDCG